jgi:hypothetical protein
LDDKFWELGWFWVLDVLVEEVWGNEGKFWFWIWGFRNQSVSWVWFRWCLGECREIDSFGFSECWEKWREFIESGFDNRGENFGTLISTW